MDKKMERRSIPLGELRLSDGEGSEPVIKGYIAVFNSPSEDMGYTEYVRPGAFTESIENDDIRALWNHDSNLVLGRNKSGTLALREDDVGLYMEVTPPDAQWARDFMETLKRGDVDQGSFGFYTLADEWSEDGRQRDLIKVQLFDVSPVTYPAYPATAVQARNLLEALGRMVDDGDRGTRDEVGGREMVENPRGEEPPTDSTRDNSEDSTEAPGSPEAPAEEEAPTGQGLLKNRLDLIDRL